MKKNVNVVSVVLLAVWLASFVAAAKGHGGHTDFGFFTGG